MPTTYDPTDTELAIEWLTNPIDLSWEQAWDATAVITEIIELGDWVSWNLEMARTGGPYATDSYLAVYAGDWN